MYQRILVALDGSDTSDLALREAIKLAKALGANLRLIHVVDAAPSYGMSGSSSFYSEYKAQLCEAGKDLLAKCAERVRSLGVDCDTVCPVIDGPERRLYGVIEEEAESWPADLIVIGTHGRSGIDRLLLGSVAQGVTRIATVPVLSIRKSSTS